MDGINWQLSRAVFLGSAYMLDNNSAQGNFGMSGWDDLLGLVKPPKHKNARRVVNCGLGAIVHRRAVDAERMKRWRKANLTLARQKEAERREARAHLYRKGGKYYEARKADPNERIGQAARQRYRRANQDQETASP